MKECEGKIGHLGFAGSDCEFAGDNGVLLAAGICGGAGDRGNERVFSDSAAVAAGFIDRAARCRLLAAAAGEAVRREAELLKRSFTMVGIGVGGWDDFVSAGDCWIHCGSICEVP